MRQLLWVLTHLPEIFGVWTATAGLLGWAFARMAHNLPEPRWYRCDACQGVFLERVPLVDHIIAAHPELLPRIDA